MTKTIDFDITLLGVRQPTPLASISTHRCRSHRMVMGVILLRLSVLIAFLTTNKRSPSSPHYLSFTRDPKKSFFVIGLFQS